jgi:hypothetical protein
VIVTTCRRRRPSATALLTYYLTVVAAAAVLWISGAWSFTKGYAYTWTDLVAVGAVLAVVVLVGLLWAWRVRRQTGEWGRAVGPLVVSALVLLVAGTVTGSALGWFSGQDQGVIRPVSGTQLVAEAAGPDGTFVQFWILYSAADAPSCGYEVRVLDANANLAESGGTDCSGTSWDPSAHWGILWAMPTFGGDTGSGAHALQVIGHAPAEAATVLVTLGNRMPVQMDVQTDGYFVGRVVWREARDDTWSIYPIHVAAVDGTGMVIAENDMG